MVRVLKDRFSISPSPESTTVDSTKDAYKKIAAEFLTLLRNPRQSSDLETWIHDLIRVVKRLHGIRDPLRDGGKYDFYVANLNIDEGLADKIWEADEAKAEWERASFEDFAGRF